MNSNKPASKQLKVEYVPVSSLNPAPYNPRKWDEQATTHLKESVKKFGMVDPLIVNRAPSRKNVVVGGHFRLHIARELGYKEVPVVFVNIPNIEREKELNLRLNRNTGTWDFELLKEIDMGMLMDVGFDDHDLTNIWDDALETEDDSFDMEEGLKRAKGTAIRPGDMFQLGPHRLLCGDSTDPTVAKRLMGSVQADLINIDMPYNIGLSYDAGLGGRQAYGGTTNDRKTDVEYRAFMKTIIGNALSVCRDDAHAFLWCDERYIGMLQHLYRECGIAQKRLCMWLKDSQNPTPQTAFNKVTEFCLYGTRGKPYLSDRVKNLNEVLNKEVGTGNRLIDDIMDLFNIWLVKRLPGSAYEHPTMKPPTLYEKSLRRCSKVGDAVLDLCAGSGSLMVACEQLKRRAYLVEIEPVFCQVIIHRYEALTNNKAEQIN